MNGSYEQYTDEELILRLREGEEQITDYIMEKYKNLVKSKAKSMYILGADREDLIQEGLIGLFKAVRDYDTGRDASFSTSRRRGERSMRLLTPIYLCTPPFRKKKAGRILR